MVKHQKVSKYYEKDCRSEIDLPGYLGKYEFFAVRQSLFSMEGDILTCKYKSKVAAEILKCLQPEEVINVESSDELEYKAIIIDGMTVANKVDIKKLKLALVHNMQQNTLKKLCLNQGDSTKFGSFLIATLKNR